MGVGEIIVFRPRLQACRPRSAHEGEQAVESVAMVPFVVAERFDQIHGCRQTDEFPQGEGPLADAGVALYDDAPMATLRGEDEVAAVQ